MKASASPRRGSKRNKGQRKDNGTGQAGRNWPVSLGWAAALVGIAVALSASVNPLFGRSVHWDWMAGLAPTMLVLGAIALRRRWV